MAYIVINCQDGVCSVTRGAAASTCGSANTSSCTGFMPEVKALTK